MSIIELLNYLLSTLLGFEFSILSLNNIKEIILTCNDWHLLLFNFELISSLVVYFSLFYLIYYLFLKAPFKLLKKIVKA